MISECADPFQPLRMGVIWPILVGCVAFYAVRFIATTVDGKWSRWQAILAGITALSAGIVTVTIANRWTGNDVYWLAFTVGLAFAACVLLANVIMQIIQADTNA